MSCKFKQNNGLWCAAIQGYCQFQVGNFDGVNCPIYHAFKNLTPPAPPTPPSQTISSVENIIMADTTDSTISCTFLTKQLDLNFN